MGPNIAIIALSYQNEKCRLKNNYPLCLGKSVSLTLCLQLENTSLLLLMVASKKYILSGDSSAVFAVKGVGELYSMYSMNFERCQYWAAQCPILGTYFQEI